MQTQIEKPSLQPKNSSHYRPVGDGKIMIVTECLVMILVILQTYWYAVLLMGIGFVITMALFIKCFAAHTPSR